MLVEYNAAFSKRVAFELKERGVKQRLQESEKLSYSIGEVRAITGVELHVLRYWEEIFSQLKPKKARNGQRTYERKDIELVLRIKELIHERGYTSKGARAVLRDESRGKRAESDDELGKFLRKMHAELVALQKTINGRKPEDLFSE